MTAKRSKNYRNRSHGNSIAELLIAIGITSKNVATIAIAKSCDCDGITSPGNGQWLFKWFVSGQLNIVDHHDTLFKWLIFVFLLIAEHNFQNMLSMISNHRALVGATYTFT